MGEPEQQAAEWSINICRANGIDIQYLRSGGPKPPLIALHGLIGSGACLVPLVRPLTDSFDVILPDARGHGGSGAPERGYLYSDLAADVRRLIGALSLHRPVLVGHSMGGMTAAVVASELGSGLAAVGLIDPTFISLQFQREVYESGVTTEHDQMLSMTKGELVAQARRRHPNRSAEVIECLSEARLRTSPNAFEVLTPPNPNWHELVRAIRAPTLLVTADKGVISLDTARELQDLNPLLRHDHVADAGHGLPYDEPERLGTSLLNFLTEAAVVENHAVSM